MKDNMTNVEIKDFLVDFKKNSETVVLETGSKESKELEKIAEARGYSIKGSRDLAMFKTVYAFVDRANKNNAIIPKKQLLKILPQLVGKPISANHNRSHVIGHYVDYKFVAKESKIIAFGVFYKSNFSELWKDAKKLFKSKKLATSFEIWNSKDSRKYINSNDYEMTTMELAGGALLFDEEPAFEGADVLTLGKKTPIDNMELVYASKHHEDEIITSEVDTLDTEKVDTKDTVIAPVVEPNVEVEKEAVETPSTKITCKACQESFEKPLAGDVKCPRCFSILDSIGTVIYPPQIKDFNISCPSCKATDWLIMSNAEKTAQVRCRYCAKTYKLEFSKPVDNELLKKLSFVREGSVRCHQCNTVIAYSGVSGFSGKSVKCKKCGLEFSFGLSEKDYRTIKKIEEVKITKTPKAEEKIEELDKSSDERRQTDNMDIPKEIVEKILASDKAKAEEVKVEEVTVEEKEEVVEETVKVEEKVVEETVESNETPEAEEKVEEVVEEKTEEVKEEKVEEKPEPAKVDKYAKSKSLRKAILKMREMKAISKTEAEKLVAGIKKTVDNLLASRAEMEKLQEDSEKKISFYKANAKKIVERRSELGETSLTDEEILNDDKFELAKVTKEALLLKASINSEDMGSEDVGEKKKDDGWYSKKRKAIDDVAFGNIGNK